MKDLERKIKIRNKDGFIQYADISEIEMLSPKEVCWVCGYNAEDLVEQLAEKEKELSEYVKIVDDLHKQLSDKCDFCDKTHNQDKISFCIDKLEKVKDLIYDLDIGDNYKGMYSDIKVKRVDVYEVIDNQIKQLTHQHEDKGE